MDLPLRCTPADTTNVAPGPPPAFADLHVCVATPLGLPADLAARTVWDEVAARLREGQAQPFVERVFGTLGSRELGLRQRADAFSRQGLDPSGPVAWIEGSPPSMGPFGGVEVWALAPRSPSARVRVLHRGGRPIGRLAEAEGARMIALCGVEGIDEGEGTLSVSTQAERMFQRADTWLKDEGFTFPQVVRTWIHLARILDWYGEFNHVRNTFFRAQGFMNGRTHSPFPASTGISGRVGEGECVMDLVAIDAAPGSWLGSELLHSSTRQERAFDYGSAFSRGMVVRVGGDQTVLVSGTASIDPSGASVRVGDAEGQVVETLMSIAALLEPCGLTLKDIVASTLFCKDTASYEAARRVFRLLHLPDFPTVPVLAHVCRTELLVEIDAVARGRCGALPDEARP